jgi:hypothetical protein
VIANQTKSHFETLSAESRSVGPLAGKAELCKVVEEALERRKLYRTHTYQRCADALDRDFGVEPSAAARALYERFSRRGKDGPTPGSLRPKRLCWR